VHSNAGYSIGFTGTPNIYVPHMIEKVKDDAAARISGMRMAEYRKNYMYKTHSVLENASDRADTLNGLTKG